jgi:hypothetical protein
VIGSSQDVVVGANSSGKTYFWCFVILHKHIIEASIKTGTHNRIQGMFNQYFWCFVILHKYVKASIKTGTNNTALKMLKHIFGTPL